jgi:8-oxo-dGTP diphosphatase
VADGIDEFALPRVASGVLYFDDAGRVMLVKPTYKPLWEIPGGYVQPGESPAAAALREVIEELGTRLPVGELLVCGREELDGLLIPRLARRVHAAIEARATGRAAYLEHGAAQRAGA